MNGNSQLEHLLIGAPTPRKDFIRPVKEMEVDP